MAGILIRSNIFWMLFLAANAAFAQGAIADPTRPPGVMALDAQSVDAGGPVLQSVLVPKKGKPVAIISGQQVPLGGTYGESRLVRLTEREAVLEGPGGSERLLLAPAVEIRNVKTSNATKTTAAGRAQSGGKP